MPENFVNKSWEDIYFDIKRKLKAAKPNYIFLDEVQNISLFEKLIDVMIDFVIKMLENMINGVINPTICVAEQAVSGILAKLMSLIEED